MITKELIQQNIPDLKEEQVQPLVELVNNTFGKELQIEIDKVRGSTFGLVDEVLKKHGYPKVNGKSTEHLDTVLITLKESQIDEKTKQKLTDSEKTIKELQEQLKTANPDFSKKETDYQQKIKLLEGVLQEKETLVSQANDKHKKDLIKLQLIASMPKVKEGIGEKTKELHVTQATNQLIELADLDEKGNVIFRNDKGEILYNASNKNNPFTPQEMYQKNDYFKEIMDEGQTQTGLGLLGTKPAGGHKMTLTGVQTQIQADDMIEKMLLTKGISKTDGRFQNDFDKIRKENNVHELPRG